MQSNRFIFEKIVHCVVFCFYFYFLNKSVLTFIKYVLVSVFLNLIGIYLKLKLPYYSHSAF